MSEARVLSDAPWLRSGPAARVLALLNGDGEEARVIGGAGFEPGRIAQHALNTHFSTPGTNLPFSICAGT